jgi:hypothetical protein
MPVVQKGKLVGTVANEYIIPLEVVQEALVPNVEKWSILNRINQLI